MQNVNWLLAQNDESDAASTIASLIVVLLAVLLAVFLIASFWIVFTKAGKPGWASIIPIYNSIVLLEISGKPLWWIILFFIPIVNFIVTVLFVIALAKSFGKSSLFGIGLLFLPFIFFPILAFGDAKYVGPQG